MFVDWELCWIFAADILTEIHIGIHMQLLNNFGQSHFKQLFQIFLYAIRANSVNLLNMECSTRLYNRFSQIIFMKV